MWQSPVWVKRHRARANAVRLVRGSLSTRLLRDRGFGHGINDWPGWSDTSQARINATIDESRY